MDVVTDTPAPTVAPTPAPTVAPATTTTAVVQPRPLDQIHQELVTAQAAHAAAVKSVSDSTGLVSALRAEYHAALTWFQQEEKTLLADFDDVVSAGESWLEKAIKSL